MDAESVFLQCASLAVDLCIFGFVYKLYRSNAAYLKSLKEAQCFEINSELKKIVEKNNGVIEYAVISGNVKCLGFPLISQHVSYLQGAIQEKIIKEHKVKWSPFLRIWSSTNNELYHAINYTQFALCGKTSGLFMKQISVEVLDPCSAQELVLPAVYNEFTSHNETVGDAVFGFFRGEKIVGFEEIENMLCENETLTAVGKLVIENNSLKITQPDNGLTYVLTPLTLESLISKVNSTTKIFKVASIIMGAVTLSLVIYFSWNSFSEIKRRIIRNREKKKWILRRIINKTRNEQDNIPKCVICLENPVEILLLECGHACMCYDCSLRITNLCPVCREPIARTVSAFWP